MAYKTYVVSSTEYIAHGQDERNQLTSCATTIICMLFFSVHEKPEIEWENGWLDHGTHQTTTKNTQKNIAEFKCTAYTHTHTDFGSCVHFASLLHD